MRNKLEETVALKQKGYSQYQIADKLGIAQRTVSQRLAKAKELGIWQGEAGEEITEQDVSGEKPKLKGCFRCPRCRKPLTSIDEVSFKPFKIGNKLRNQGFSHVCLFCKVAYAREIETECPKCESDLIRIKRSGQLLGYYCENCKILYEEKELEKKETETVEEEET